MRFLPNRSAGTGRRPLVLAGTAIVWLAGFLPAPVPAQDNAPVPLTKQRLLQTMDLLKGDAADVLIPQIQQRGVSFQMNAADERDLREAGASDKLLTAVRASYRTPPLPPVTGGAPLGVDELSLLLRNGAPASRVEDLVAVRGVSFAAAPAVIQELRAAGASDRLLDLVKLRGAGGVTGQPPPAQTYVAPQPTPAPPPPTPTPTPVSVEPEPEPVWVVFYQICAGGFLLKSPTIIADQSELATLSCNKYFYTAALPGTHTFCASKGRCKTAFLTAGTAAYWRVEPRITIGFNFDEVPVDLGASQVSQLMPLETKRFLAPDLVTTFTNRPPPSFLASPESRRRQGGR